MNLPVSVLIVTFAAFLLLRVPIAITIAMSTLLAILATGEQATAIVALQMTGGVESFTLLAIPFFILSGILMGRGGMAERLIDFASALLGSLPGGLAYVNAMTCMLFGAISGSAVAAVSSIGGALIPEMNRKGYDRDFNVSLTVCAATTGLIIPPSNIMIVYAVVASGTSVGAMFIAGILPGILLGLCLMAVCFLLRGRSGGGRGEAFDAGHLGRTFIAALPSLLMVIIVIGGIFAGIFTATEAAAVAVAYSALVTIGFYREVKLADLGTIFLQTGVTTAVVLLLVGASSAMSWLLATQNIPQVVSDALLGSFENPIMLLLIINCILILVGTFMDMTPAVLIFTPIFLPIALQLGMHPVHFGIMIIANLCIGLCTPPVGSCLFVGCGVGKTSITAVTRPILPFLAAMLVALLLITFIPGLSLWLPRLLDQIP